ncbi:MAG TPA: nickel pincer cofactor biosynthesis protein LarB [Archaeoglobaceae archaeon]|nr:nickel pincer cofactor biosynthesis protein LarB [Archaeoglobaceae archaeon]
MPDERELKELFFKQIEELAKIDHCRDLRAGKPEAIFAEFKEPEEIIKIARGYLESAGKVLVTRADKSVIESLKNEFEPSGYCVRINKKGRTVIIDRDALGASKKEKTGRIAIVTAGTSDIAVAEEAASTAEFLGMEVLKFYDVGVAGIHRLVEPLKKINSEEVDAIIAVAGMEGALPSVIAGLVDIPVIAVPTSVGYGTNLNGLTTLFAMLQSCSSGVAVVNIDNGFGAAVFASMISRKVRKSPI